MFSIIQIFIISIIFGFIIHQIISFFTKPAPKIKYKEIEKYKSLLENAAISLHPPSPSSNIKSSSSSSSQLIEVTNDICVLSDDDIIGDNESIYSAGYMELKNEMEEDLLRVVLGSVDEPQNKDSLVPLPPLIS